MPKSADVFCGDLADNLHFKYKDTYTFYQTSPFLELTRDTVTCLPMLSTPDRAQSGTRFLGPMYLRIGMDIHPSRVPRALSSRPRHRLFLWKTCKRCFPRALYQFHKFPP